MGMCIAETFQCDVVVGHQEERIGRGGRRGAITNAALCCAPLKPGPSVEVRSRRVESISAAYFLFF